MVQRMQSSEWGGRSRHIRKIVWGGARRAGRQEQEEAARRQRGGSELGSELGRGGGRSVRSTRKRQRAATSNCYHGVAVQLTPRSPDLLEVSTLQSIEHAARPRREKPRADGVLALDQLHDERGGAMGERVSARGGVRQGKRGEQVAYEVPAQRAGRCRVIWVPTTLCCLPRAIRLTWRRQARDATKRPEESVDGQGEKILRVALLRGVEFTRRRLGEAHGPQRQSAEQWLRRQWRRRRRRFPRDRSVRPQRVLAAKV